MKQRGTSREPEDLDGLRLFALGRIPRCTRCPRYRALLTAHSARSRVAAVLPRVPEFCSHQVCAPLIDRARQTRPAWAHSPEAACGC